MIWQSAPSKQDAKNLIMQFFEELPDNAEKAFSTVQVKPPAASSLEPPLHHHLHGIWEDLEEWWQDLDDNSAGEPFAQSDSNCFCWDFSSDSEQLTAGDRIIVEVHLLGELNDTAQFVVYKTERGYELFLDLINIM